MICTANTKQMQTCYSYCPDDPNLLRQLQSQMSNQIASCEFVAQAKANGVSSISVAATATATLADGKTIAVPVPKVTGTPSGTGSGNNKNLPPLATKKPGDNGPITLVNSGAESLLGSFFMAAAGILAAL